eukprot:975624-Amphidinium_carterae.1
MAYVDDLLVVGDNLSCYSTIPTAVNNSAAHFEAHHTADKVNITRDDGSVQLFFSTEYYNKILKPYNVEKCNSSTIPGNKKPPIAAQTFDKEQHSMFRTAVGQLLWVSQLGLFWEWTFPMQ